MRLTDCLPREEFPSGIKGIIFDCDGVLLDSRDSNMEFYNRIRTSIGLPRMSPEEEDYVHMASVEEAIRHIIPESMLNSAEAARALIRYHADILPLLHVESNLLNTLDWLKKWRVRLAVCTNRSESVLTLLAHFHLENYFDPIKHTRNSTPKPSPDGILAILEEWSLPACEVAFIGDSKADEQAAKAAHVPFFSFKNGTLRARVHLPGYPELRDWLAPLVEHS